MKYRQLGKINEQLSAIGLGCMAMADSFAYGPSDENESAATLHRALELGINFWDTADMYGVGANERLISKVLVPNRDKVFIATKFGFVPNEGGGSRLDVRPERIRQAAEDSLRRLGIDTIDLYYAHRVDPAVPVEDMVGEMSRLVEEGKVRYLGLSEASAQSLRRAYAVHPIAALQSEYSLFTREVEAEVLPTARELGITFVPYSPLGRGILTNTYQDLQALETTDFRRTIPRFQPEALDSNRALVEALREIAESKAATTAQLALAWLLAQGDDVIPIPGTKRRKYLEENAAAADIALTDTDLRNIAEILKNHPVVGERYSEGALKLVNR
ncbi:aldo/keto reductase [Larkinella soli]|uniref:aldo/keto reductase n=1 Tax=Larkinella soli TaxID=1770527 RepID=UPI000FFC14CA|nr:aldo/keto reductase [Larkinella soli]